MAQHPMNPPRWAEAWLRLVLPLRDRDTVSGDLLEEYRDAVRPSRSRFAADLWYIGQASVFAWRLGVWAVFLATTLVGRTALDWFVPVANFTLRAEATTLKTASILLVIGASTALRTQSGAGGVIGTATVLVLNAIVCTVAYGVMYALWHDPQTLAAIARSGGLLEVFMIPVALILPGTAIGAFGAWLASKRRAAKTSHVR